MRSGLKRYLGHFIALAVLTAIAVFTCCEEIMPNALNSLLYVAAFVYFALLFMGVTLAIGPLKHISHGLLQDHEEHLAENRRAKQPWE